MNILLLKALLQYDKLCALNPEEWKKKKTFSQCSTSRVVVVVGGVFHLAARSSKSIKCFCFKNFLFEFRSVLPFFFLLLLSSFLKSEFCCRSRWPWSFFADSAPKLHNKASNYLWACVS